MDNFKTTFTNKSILFKNAILLFAKKSIYYFYYLVFISFFVIFGFSFFPFQILVNQIFYISIFTTFVFVYAFSFYGIKESHFNYEINSKYTKFEKYFSIYCTCFFFSIFIIFFCVIFSIFSNLLFNSIQFGSFSDVLSFGLKVRWDIFLYYFILTTWMSFTLCFLIQNLVDSQKKYLILMIILIILFFIFSGWISTKTLLDATPIDEKNYVNDYLLVDPNLVRNPYFYLNHLSPIFYVSQLSTRIFWDPEYLGAPIKYFHFNGYKSSSFQTDYFLYFMAPYIITFIYGSLGLFLFKIKNKQ